MGSQVRELNRLHKDNFWPRLLTFKQGYRWAWPVVKGEPSHMNLNFVRSALALTHTLQTFEPVRFIPRFYCIYLLHAEGEIVDFGEKIKKQDAKKVCSVCLDSESAMDDWVLGTCLFLWDTIELNEKRIYTLFSLVFREFQSSCRHCYQYKFVWKYLDDHWEFIYH